jgi:ApaG protein
MSTAVSHDIRISVRARFEPAQSDPVEGRFIFSYRITIANRGSRAVQLMERTWFISDSLAPQRRVSGKGVVGLHPNFSPASSSPTPASATYGAHGAACRAITSCAT